jgi:hypothetical protein
MLREQHQLIHDHRTQSEQLRALQALHRHLDPPFKDALVQAVEGCDGVRAQCVKHVPDLHAPIVMGRRASSGGDQLTATLVALLPQRRVVVVGITQPITHFTRQLRQQQGSHLIVASIRHGQFGRQGNPHCPHGHRQMEFPALPPTMPARLAPASCCIDRGVRDDALFPMCFVPHAPASRQRCAITRDRAAMLGPEL